VILFPFFREGEEEKAEWLRRIKDEAEKSGDAGRWIRYQRC
jgi:hypothetical protein